KVCSYQDVLDHLNLTTDNSVFKLTRPVLDHTHPTLVGLDIVLYAILAMVGAQWNDERISWDPTQFCGITGVSVPRDMLWKPDLFIFEMVQKDESPLCPYIYMSFNGMVTDEQGIRVVSTCNMNVHKFPFDTQRCNISFSSAIHTVDQVRLFPSSNSSRATEFSQEIMKTQGEWDFLQLSVTNSSLTIDKEQWDMIIYTFTMKRRPLLYVINFLLPILFFLCLDLSSFFISDERGEKLGFKVTVMLAISVLLLILNDILPSMSNKTPLIGTYCIVIFALMLLSLIETILVTYLMEAESASQEKLKFKDDCEDKGEKVRTDNCSAGETHHRHEQGSQTFAYVTKEVPLCQSSLKELQKTLNLHLGCREERGKFAQWATIINRVFFIFYVTTVSLFLPLIYNEWIN
uniref:Uncharacterized protein n=1 Tax=Monopterus albus TaxID=43700 RepID=A0A3Q3QS10_MONAL